LWLSCCSSNRERLCFWEICSTEITVYEVTITNVATLILLRFKQMSTNKLIVKHIRICISHLHRQVWISFWGWTHSSWFLSISTVTGSLLFIIGNSTRRLCWTTIASSVIILTAMLLWTHLLLAQIIDLNLILHVFIYLHYSFYEFKLESTIVLWQNQFG